MVIPSPQLSDSPKLRSLDWSPEIKPGWIPVGIDRLRPIVRWMNVGNASLTAPMFMEAVARFRLNRAQEIETGLSVLMEGTAHLLGGEPRGVIVHMTRCGSTALANAMR